VVCVLISVFRYFTFSVASDRENSIVFVFDMGIKCGVAQVGFAAATEVVALACCASRPAFLLVELIYVLVNERVSWRSAS